MSYKRERQSGDLPTPQVRPINRESDANHSVQQGAKIVVGVDFGTTFSGFAYALKSDPDNVYTFYDWPGQAAAGAKPYCKTPTSLWYLRQQSGTIEVQDWGWSAHVNYSKALQARNAVMRNATCEPASLPSLFSTTGHFLTKFKLHLAAVEPDLGRQQMSEELPDGISVERAISDYLNLLSTFIMAELRNKFGSDIVKKDVLWCLTVPTIWTDAAKQRMVKCSQMAGLVQGRNCTDNHASAHPIVIVLEPEAASVYCQQKLKNGHFRKGSKFLVVDAGGGTVDLVVHEKSDEHGVRVKEVACSTGDLCGGAFVDKAFMEHLAGRIGCFDKFCNVYPASLPSIKTSWENFKASFDGLSAHDMELPAKLATMWEASEETTGNLSENSHYDEICITANDAKMIFDGEVNKILKLIEDQLALVFGVEAIMVVGGFSCSPYLMKRIRETFSSTVNHIVSPTEPGSAVCQGSVAFGALGPDIMMSRKSRKTYGIATAREFVKGDPPNFMVFSDLGEALCDGTFEVFCRIGDDIPVNHLVTHQFEAMKKAHRRIDVSMYSTTDSEPQFITDPGVIKVSSWLYDIPEEAQQMEEMPEIEVTMYFGRTLIELFAKPLNFAGEKIRLSAVAFERDLF